MKANDLKALIKKALKETKQNLNEAEKCGPRNCTCSDGTRYICTRTSHNEPNCECCSEANCDVARELLGGGKVKGPGVDRGLERPIMINLSNIKNSDISRGEEAPQGKTMGENILQERFQQLAGIKPLYEAHCSEGQILMAGRCVYAEGDEENKLKKRLINEELFTVLGALVGFIGAALGAGHLQDMAEDPAIAEKYPALKDVFDILSTIGKDAGAGIKEAKELTEGIFAAIGGLVGVLGAAGVTTAIEMALEDPAIAEKYPKMVKVFEFLRKVGGAVSKGIK